MTCGVDFQDLGNLVELSLDLQDSSPDVSVHSTTTQLSVKDGFGNSILDIPQLYSTVDASETRKSHKGRTLRITLKKHSPEEGWPALEPEKILPPKPSAYSNDSEGAMEARNLVKQLFEAALHGSIEDIERIAPSVSPSGLSSVKDGNGRNALHFAAQGGQLEAAAYLLHKEGISVNSQDDKGETALGLAAGGGQLEVVRLLIKEGADVQMATGSNPKPLHRAAAIGNQQIVALLLEEGADVEAPSESGTPLLWAAASGSAEIVAQLLHAGANPDAQNADGVTSTLMAAAAGNAQIIDKLAQHGANASLPAHGGVTALHAAAEIGDIDTVQALLKAEADPNAVDSEMSKPIHAAAFSGHAAIVEILFPETSPREGEKWSVEALMAETSSAGSASSPQQASKGSVVGDAEEFNPEKAASCKREGDVAFVDKQFGQAELAYTKSLKHDPKNHLVWANRSAARFRLGKAEEAMSDAQTSRQLNPKYLKAWYREGEAARALEKYETAAQAFYEAYTLDPTSKLIARDFQDAVAKGREQYAKTKAKQQR